MINKKKQVADFIEGQVLRVHSRNGGRLDMLDFKKELMYQKLQFDSLDFAEIVALIEMKYEVSLFENENNINTWEDLVDYIASQMK